MKVAYCTGFWCTNVGNGFFSLGVEYALKKVLGDENVTVVSDYQTYTTSYGKRLYADKNQIEYISSLNVDYIVLAGPVLSKYFLTLWKDVLLKLKHRGVGYIILSAGMMKLTKESCQEIKAFFEKCPPYAFSSRDEAAYKEFGTYAECSNNGICFSFFTPDYYNPAKFDDMSPYVVYNFDKISEPDIWIGDTKKVPDKTFEYKNEMFKLAYPKIMAKITSTTDRFTDALIYIRCVLPGRIHGENIGSYKIIRTDHRFHPHFRSKIYREPNSFVADLPYGYINLYANAEFTLSDRVHACAVTLAFGHSAMLFAKTNRHGLLERAGAEGISERLVKLDMNKLDMEKQIQIQWLTQIFNREKSSANITLA